MLFYFASENNLMCETSDELWVYLALLLINITSGIPVQMIKFNVLRLQSNCRKHKLMQVQGIKECQQPETRHVINMLFCCSLYQKINCLPLTKGNFSYSKSIVLPISVARIYAFVCSL